MNTKSNTNPHPRLKSFNLQPAQPIETVYSERKGVFASIKKIINSCKSFFGFVSNHNFEPINVENVKFRALTEQEKLVNSIISDAVSRNALSPHEVSLLETKLPSVQTLVKILIEKNNALSTEGIFRIPGQETAMQFIKDNINKSNLADLDICSLAGALKSLCSEVNSNFPSEENRISLLMNQHHEDYLNLLKVKVGEIFTEKSENYNALLDSIEKLEFNTFTQQRAQIFEQEVSKAEDLGGCNEHTRKLIRYLLDEITENSSQWKVSVLKHSEVMKSPLAQTLAPLIAGIVKNSDKNKMSAHNLAIAAKALLIPANTFSKNTKPEDIILRENMSAHYFEAIATYMANKY
ncbi:RhoGAP domain-containing protein [Providencia hangzhouensis]